MQILKNVITVKQITMLNLKRDDVMTFDFQWQNGVENYYLKVNGERLISFDSERNRRISRNKIRRIGLALGWSAPQLTDEEEGIIQASKNGENPFAYTIISKSNNY